MQLAAAALEVLAGRAQHLEFDSGIARQPVQIDRQLIRACAALLQTLSQGFELQQIQMASRLLRRFAPQQPLFARGQEARRLGLRQVRAWLMLAHAPGLKGQHIRTLPDPLATCELAGGVGEAHSVRALARWDDQGGASAQGLRKSLWKSDQYNPLCETLLRT